MTAGVVARAPLLIAAADDSVLAILSLVTIVWGDGSALLRGIALG